MRIVTLIENFKQKPRARIEFEQIWREYFKIIIKKANEVVAFLVVINIRCVDTISCPYEKVVNKLSKDRRQPVDTE